MAKRLSEAEWAKIRYDREKKGLSFRELVVKYNVGIGTIHRRAKEDNWSEPDNEKQNGTNGTNGTEQSKSRSKKKTDVKPECLQEDTENTKDDEDEQPPKKDKYRFVKRNADQTNGTQNGTPDNSESFDIQGYVNRLKDSFDPSRPRDKKYLEFQLGKIDEHLGDLSNAFDGCGFNGKYRPEFARIAYNIALLGGTPESLAQTLNVSEQTIYNWLSTYQEFHIAWHGGKDFADATVVKALFKRAVGYKEVVEDYKTERGELVPVEKTFIFAGDVQAQMFWLKNRQPHNWKDKVEVQEEIAVAVVDHAAANERYERILNKASSLKSSLADRGPRLGLTLDGESEEID